MSRFTLRDYLDHAETEEEKVRIKEQWQAASHGGPIPCRCGDRGWVRDFFRCLFCGEFFCHHCAEVHFGMAVEEWYRRKRAAKRLAAEAKSRS
jgi:hypothetical protein